jgi:hypothetical protein
MRTDGNDASWTLHSARRLAVCCNQICLAMSGRRQLSAWSGSPLRHHCMRFFGFNPDASLCLDGCFVAVGNIRTFKNVPAPVAPRDSAAT